MTTGIKATSASASDSTLAVRDTARGSRNRTTPGAIKTLFKAAVKAVALRSNAAPQPEARKRRGGTDSRAPLCVTPRLDRQGGKPAARGKYVVLSAGKRGAGKIVRRFTRAANDAVAHEAHEDMGLYLATGLEFVQFWQDNAQYDFLDDHLGAQQDRYFPQL